MRSLNPANPANIGARPDDWTPTAEETGAYSKARVDNLLGAIDIVSRGTQIPKNADLNDYTTPGKYYSPNTAWSGTISNKPYTQMAGFSLYVLRQSSGNIIQAITQNTNHGDNMVLIRTSEGLTSFNSWYHFSLVEMST
jgi:hypothetical protein